MPSHAIILCLIYPILGLVLARIVLGYSVLPLLFPLAAGFALSVRSQLSVFMNSAVASSMENRRRHGVRSR